MSRTRKAILLLVWLIVATHAYAYIWSTHLDLFPQLPERLGRWIADLTGTAGSEDIEQLTLYYILIVSFFVVAVATFLWMAAILAFRKFRKLR
jgi:hypothetical protein